MLPADDAGAPEPAFAREARSPAWASEHEEEIRGRTEAVITGMDAGGAVRLESVDCRSRRCELVVAGERSEPFDQVLAAMQDERGFHGWARQLMLRDLRRDGERARVTVVLSFD